MKNCIIENGIPNKIVPYLFYEPDYDWLSDDEDGDDDEDYTFCPICGGRESDNEDCACVH